VGRWVPWAALAGIALLVVALLPSPPATDPKPAFAGSKLPTVLRDSNPPPDPVRDAELAEAAEEQRIRDLVEFRLAELRGLSTVDDGDALAWVEDASSETPARRDAARARAGAGLPEDVALLADLVRRRPEVAPQMPPLVAALPESGVASSLALDVLRAAPPAEASSLATAIGGKHLLRRGTFSRAMLEGTPEARLAVAALERPRSDAWPEDRRAALADGLRSLLGNSDVGIAAAAGKRLGDLAVPGVARDLIALLRRPDSGLRIQGAVSLSRVPDLELVSTEATARLLALLVDPGDDVREAGRRLAEALAGGRVDYDPSAEPTERLRLAVEVVQAIQAKARERARASR
jgi:hypothetical protein